MAARPEAERRREKPLDLPECEGDEELLLRLRETERLLTLLAPKRPDETNIKNEGRANGLTSSSSSSSRFLGPPTTCSTSSRHAIRTLGHRRDSTRNKPSDAR